MEINTPKTCCALNASRKIKNVVQLAFKLLAIENTK